MALIKSYSLIPFSEDDADQQRLKADAHLREFSQQAEQTSVDASQASQGRYISNEIFKVFIFKAIREDLSAIIVIELKSS
jgi:hypothetical protein